MACGATNVEEPPSSATPLHEAAPSPAEPALPGNLSEGTKQMAALLKRIVDTSNPLENAYDNAARVEKVRKMLAQANDPEIVDQLENMLAIDLLFAGSPREAIERFEDLHARGVIDPNIIDFFGDYSQLRGVSYLRMAEQDNCIAHHGTDSCLLPIRGSGVHTEQEGSRAAIVEFTEALRLNPLDAGAVWLLNIAYMTLGEYPDQVPPRYLIPPASFEADRDFKEFHDVAAASGLRIVALSGGSVLDDFDNDGDLDIMVSFVGIRDQLRVFRNDGNGGFTEVTDEAGVLGEIGGLNLVSGDYDNDGYVDVLVVRGGWFGKAGKVPNSLLRNRQDGTFEDVTKETGLLTFRPSQVASWADYDGNGWLDLFVGNEAEEDQYNPSELWLSNGDGTFSNRAEISASRCSDMSREQPGAITTTTGDPDLFLSRVRFNTTRTVLFRNEGPGPNVFHEVHRRSDRGRSVDAPTISASPTWFWDYDNDGWLDLAVVAPFGVFRRASSSARLVARYARACPPTALACISTATSVTAPSTERRSRTRASIEVMLVDGRELRRSSTMTAGSTAYLRNRCSPTSRRS